MSDNRQLTVALFILISNQSDWPILLFFNHNIWLNRLKNNFNFKLNAIAIAFKTMSDDVRQPATNGSSFYTNCQSKWPTWWTSNILIFNLNFFNHNIWFNKLKNNFKLNAIALKTMSDEVRQPATNGTSFYTNCQSKWLAYLIHKMTGLLIFNHNIWLNKWKNNFAFKLNAIAIAFKPMSDEVRQPATNGTSLYTNCQSKWLAYLTNFYF